MKKSIAYLPEQKQEDLRRIVELVLEELPDCEMIILYGSYARNNYVDYDQRIEYGVPTYFMSDYDILVVTREGQKGDYVWRRLNKVIEKFYRNKNRMIYTSVQFINDTITTFSNCIERGMYFYSDIKKEGVLLYDSGKYKLPRRRKQNFTQIEELAKVYFLKNFNRGEDFLLHATFSISKQNYVMASFMLHQACENFYHAIILTYTLYTYKEHNLGNLAGGAKRHSLKVSFPFPRDTEEEERLFNLLLKAYVQSRYNPDFVVTKEDIEALLPKVELLRDITRERCEERIKEYGMKKRSSTKSVE